MGSKSRVLLAWSFGALLFLVAVTGATSLIVFEKIRAGEAELRVGFAERSALLNRIRSGVYLSGTLARDYLAVQGDPEASKVLGQLGVLEAETKKAAAQYAGTGLRAELTVYWKTLNLMADVGAHRPRSAGLDSYFSRQLAQRRDAAARVANEIEAALIHERESGAAAQAALYRRFQWVFGIGLTLVVALGAAVSFIAVRRLLRLEAETRALAAQVVQVQEEERRRIARELHDEVGQALSRLLLDIGRMPLPEIRAQAEHTLEAARRIALALRPSMLDDLGLVAALEWQAREVAHRTGLHVQVDAEDSAGELPDTHRTCIYRVAQEALENCARHARARSVTIGLERVARTVSLKVRDDGTGFAAARSRGLGLLGMEERVAQLGGRLLVNSQPGEGTTVTAELPV